MMQTFINNVFPGWGSSSTYIQLTARMRGKSVDVEFVQNFTELNNVIKAWSKCKYDIYYTLSTFSEIKTGKKSRFKRLVHTVSAYRRHVILDFDFKDQPDYFREIKPMYNAVVSAIGIPHMVVSSGGGMHFYYRVKTTDNNKLLELQQRAMSKFRRLSDTTPVVDKRACAALSDIIRIPSSVNQKIDKKVTYRVMEEEGGYLQTGRLPQLVGATFRKLNISFTGTGNYYADNFIPPDLGPVAYFENLLKVCAVARLYVKDSAEQFKRIGGVCGDHEDVLNWCSITKFTESQTKPTHTHQEEVFSMMDTAPKSQGDWKMGHLNSVNFPRGCTRWSDHYRHACKGCTYFDSYDGQGIPTPIGAAKKLQVVVEAETTKKQLIDIEEGKNPDAHKGMVDMGKYLPIDNGVYKPRGEGKTPYVVTHNLFRMYPGKVINENGCFVSIHIASVNRDETIRVKGNDNAIIEELASKGITVAPKRTKTHNPREDLLDYFRVQLSQTQIVSDTCGVVADNKLSLPEATYVVGEDKVVKATNPPVLLSKSNFILSKKGSAEAWWDSANELYFSLEPMSVYAKFIMASFISPLYKLVNVERQVAGHTMVIVGAPGCGKTQALNSAASVWGCNGFSTTKSDSYAHLINSFRHTPNLPVTFDDIMRTGVSIREEDIAMLTHTVSEGRSRGRARSDGSGNQATHNFNLVLLGTSNESLKNSIAKQQQKIYAATAGMDRITEHWVEDVSDIALHEFGVDIIELSVRHADILMKNGGYAGREFILFCMQNLEEVNRLCAQEYVHVRSKLGNLRHEAKFMSLILTAKKILRNMGRLVDKDSTESLYEKLPKADVQKFAKEQTLEALVSSIPTPYEIFQSISMFSCPAKIEVYGKMKVRSVVPAPSHKMQPSQLTGLMLWVFEKGKAPVRCMNNLAIPRDSSYIVVLAWQPALVSRAFRSLDCSKDPEEVLSIWKTQSLAIVDYTSNFKIKWRMSDKTVYTGRLVSWAI